MPLPPEATLIGGEPLTPESWALGDHHHTESYCMFCFCGVSRLGGLHGLKAWKKGRVLLAVVERNLEYQSTISSHLQSKQNGPRPAIVLLHDAWNLADPTPNLAARFFKSAMGSSSPLGVK